MYKRLDIRYDALCLILGEFRGSSDCARVFAGVTVSAMLLTNASTNRGQRCSERGFDKISNGLAHESIERRTYISMFRERAMVVDISASFHFILVSLQRRECYSPPTFFYV